MRKSFVIAIVFSLALALAAGPVLAQAPKATAKQPAPAAQMKLTITGKIAKGQQGYIIQGQKPPELFTILNPNPKVLDKLVKSGKTVTIEAVSVIGDNINIHKINGKPYKEAKAGKTKGK